MHGTNIKIAKEMLASEAEECCVVLCTDFVAVGLQLCW